MESSLNCANPMARTISGEGVAEAGPRTTTTEMGEVMVSSGTGSPHLKERPGGIVDITPIQKLNIDQKIDVQRHMNPPGGSGEERMQPTTGEEKSPVAEDNKEPVKEDTVDSNGEQGQVDAPSEADAAEGKPAEGDSGDSPPEEGKQQKS